MNEQPNYQNAVPPQGTSQPAASANVVYAAPKAPLRVPASGRDIVFMLIYFVLSVAAIDLGLLGGFNLGYSVTAAAIIIFTLIYSAIGNRLSIFGAYCGICAAGIAAGFTLSSSGFVKFWGFFAVWALLLMILLDNTGCGRFPSGGWSSFIDMLRLSICTPFERMGSTFGSLKDVGNADSAAFKRFTGVIIGVLCAVPALAVILPLLMSSDAAFDVLLRNTVFSNLPRLLVSVVLGFVFFLLTFVSIFAAKNRVVYVTGNVPKTVPEHGIPAVGVNSFLGAISLVYAVYLLSQLSYFFSAFAGFLPEDFTLAEYARRGFFEMSVICLINLIMIGLTLILVRRDSTGNPPFSTRMICLFISVFSLAVVATVCAKLALYMNDLGLTRLRVYTTLFCIILAVVFICIAIRLFCRRFSYFRVCTAILAAACVAVSVVNIDAVIAGYNYDSYMSGHHKEIDVETIADMDDSGIPYLIMLLDDKDEDVRAAASSELVWRADKYVILPEDMYDSRYDYYDDSDDKMKIRGGCEIRKIDSIRRYSKPFAEAQTAIAENWEKIKEVYNSTPEYLKEWNGW